VSNKKTIKIDKRGAYAFELNMMLTMKMKDTGGEKKPLGAGKQ